MRHNPNSIYHGKTVLLVEGERKGCKGIIRDTNILGLANVELLVVPINVVQVHLKKLLI